MDIYFSVFAFYYIGIVASMAIQIVLHPSTKLSFPQAFFKLIISFGSWLTLFWFIRRRRRK